MKYIFKIIVVITFISCAMSCKPQDNNKEKTREVLQDTTGRSREALTDVMFTRGFVLTGATHNVPYRTETFGQKDVMPVWQLSQWHSKGLLNRIHISDNTIALRDDSKSVTIDRISGAINLTVHASKEYTTPRLPSDPWVHLLLEQIFLQPAKIADASEIWVEVEFELAENKSYEGQTPGHAAQLLHFMYLRNTNPQSKGYNDLVCFGMRLFDNRYDLSDDYAAQDYAVTNGNFIFSLGSKRFLDKPVTIGNRMTIRRNIMSEIHEAIETAHQRGFITNTTIEDVALTFLSIGWEVSGVYDVGVTLHKISVRVIE